jgi:hypothetical protein
MYERVAATARLDTFPGRHCWVIESREPSRATVKRPGLLVEWRRAAGGGWQGRVVYLTELGAGRWAIVEEWVAQARLSPT